MKTMDDSTLGLPPYKRQSDAPLPRVVARALDALKVLLRAHFGTSLDSLIVFGSAARGEFSEASDIDVLIVMGLLPQEVDWRLERDIRNLVFGVELEHNVVLDLHVISATTMRGPRSHTPFLEAVCADGCLV
jgi:predicted nucleotidyltransferase